MPMIPSALAGIVYAAVKVGGYAAFAYGLNRITDKSASPIKFAGAKTALGLAGGIAYVFGLASAIGISAESDFLLFVGAAPIRILVWTAMIGLFYGFRANPRLMTAAVLLGVVWSYALDGVMWVIYKVLPGMVMPFC